MFAEDIDLLPAGTITGPCAQMPGEGAILLRPVRWPIPSDEYPSLPTETDASGECRISTADCSRYSLPISTDRIAPDWWRGRRCRAELVQGQSWRSSAPCSSKAWAQGSSTQHGRHFTSEADIYALSAPLSAPLARRGSTLPNHERLVGLREELRVQGARSGLRQRELSLRGLS